MNLTCEQCRLHHVSGGTSYCGIDRAPAYKPDSCRHDAIPDLLSDLTSLESEYAILCTENSALNLALFHVDNGLSHPDERVRKLIAAAEAARGATP